MKKIKIFVILLGISGLFACTKDKEDDLANFDLGEIRITVNGITKDLKNGVARITYIQEIPVFSMVAYKERTKPYLEQLAISFYNMAVEIKGYNFGILGNTNLGGTYVITINSVPITYMTLAYSQYTGELSITELTENYVKGTFHFIAFSDQNQQSIEVTDGKFYLPIDN